MKKQETFSSSLELLKKSSRAKLEKIYEYGIQNNFISDVTPYFKKIDEIVDKSDKKIFFICMGTQMGKTFYLLNRINYYLSNQLGVTIGYALPSQTMAKQFAKDKFSKIFLCNPDLKNLLDTKISTIYNYYVGNCIVKIFWTSSRTQLVSDTYNELFIDELDLHTNKQNNDILTLLKARVSVKQGKIFCISSPTERNGRIWQGVEKGTYNLFYWNCEKCGKAFAPNIENFFICPFCGFVFSDDKKQNLNESGFFIAKNVNADEIESFYIPGVCSPWNSIESLKIEKKKIINDEYTEEEKKSILNSKFGELYFSPDDAQEDIQNLTITDITKNIRENVNVLYKKKICSIDVQIDRIYFVVRGYENEKSHLIDYGEMYGNTSDTSFFNAFFTKMDSFNIDFFIIDVAFKEHELLKLRVMLNRNNIFFIRGYMGLDIVSIKKILNERVIFINDFFFKSLLIDEIKKNKNWGTNEKILSDGENYIRSMLAEKKIQRNGKFLFVKRHHRNDFFDCEKYNIAFNFILNRGFYNGND